MSEKLTKSFPAFISKADGDAGIVSAFTSVLGNIDYGDDIIANGAFVKTIVERADKIRVLDNHNSRSTMDAIGKIVTIQEVGQDKLPTELRAKYPDATGGLYVEIQFMLDDEISAGVFRRIKAGVIDEYSIGFEITRQEIKTVETDEGTRRIRYIREIKLYEVSPVIFAMNDATTTVSAKSADADKAKEEEGEKDSPIYSAGEGQKSCVGCKMFGKVTEDLGFCTHHKLASASVMRCDDYDTFNRKLVREPLAENFLNWMQGQAAAFMELGAWTESDKERFDTLLPTLSEAFLDMLPKDMSEREIPAPQIYTAPKALEQSTIENAAPLDSAKSNADILTPTFSLEADIMIAQIEARMKKA